MALDLEMASAVCPLCHIVLVEANSPSWFDVFAAVDTAAARSDAVSNSYGGPEAAYLVSAGSAHYDHPGVAMVASSGDGGYAAGPQLPAAFSTVTGVGGTVLSRDGSARGFSETAWGGAGSGCSATVAKPAFQQDTGCTGRTIADVAAVAANVAVYSVEDGGWVGVGGTSVASPIVAAMYALAGDTSTYHDPARLYANSSALFDITTGQNGACTVTYLCHGTVGYDGPTGMGTPNGEGAFGSTLGKPGAPTLTGYRAGNGWVAVAWGPPASSGNSPITSYVVTTSPGGQTVSVPAGATRAVVTVPNGTTQTAHVQAVNSFGPSDVSNDSAPFTPASATVSVPTQYSAADNMRLLRNAAYFGQTAVDAQRASVGVIAYIVGTLHNPNATPVAPPALSGSNTYTTPWSVADQGALVTVMRQYGLMPNEAQYFCVMLVGYLLGLTGH